MPALIDDFLFLVVLAVPGFLVVSVGRYLSGVGESSPQFETGRLILVWSVIADTVVVLTAPIWPGLQLNGLDGLRQSILGLSIDMLILWLLVPLVLGIIYAITIIVRLPYRLRKILQSKNVIKRLPEPPWRNFFDEHDYVIVYTDIDDDNSSVFFGRVGEYSSSKADRELIIRRPYKWDEKWVPMAPDKNRKNNLTDEYLPDKKSQLLIHESHIEKTLSIPEPPEPEVEIQ
jgi:hypothetical protein